MHKSLDIELSGQALVMFDESSRDIATSQWPRRLELNFMRTLAQ